MTKPPSPRSIATKQQVLDALDGTPSPDTLNAALVVLARWRADLLENTLAAQDGNTITAGPFAGMIYPAQPHTTARAPRLTGSYESCLAPVIAQIIADAPPLIMDIGCGDGYYAVGLARALNNTIVWARDADDAARAACEALSTANYVQGRVKIGGKLTHADFDICRAQHTVILCDIGGDEDALLDPERAKGLRRADILVEVHESTQADLTNKIADRFSDTHHISIYSQTFSSDPLPDWMDGMTDLDRLLAVWEMRRHPVRWLWMQRKSV